LLNEYLDKGAEFTSDIDFPIAVDATQQRSRREGPLLSYTPTALQEGFQQCQHQVLANAGNLVDKIVDND
jgi:hypothetical protein